MKVLSRREASVAVFDLGWRFLLGTLRTSVRVGSWAEAARVVAACGDDVDGHLQAEVRADRVVLALRSRDIAAVTDRDVELAYRITVAVSELGLRTEPRPLQAVEIAIDALDIAAVRPFWEAVLDESSLPVWFQQMDRPRPQRNRIHLDICVPHDEAPGRILAALAAGGRIVSDAHAPAFWVLADPEGNEACITTWQGRD
jgi:4a-hydroxytetrahydrobiopterin dehydratase